MTELFLLCICICLIVLIIFIYGCSYVCTKRDNFENLKDNQRSLCSNIISNELEQFKTFNYSDINRFWNDNKQVCIMVTIDDNGKYTMTNSGNQLYQERMKYILDRIPNLPKCKFIQFFGDKKLNYDLPILQNSVGSKELGLMSPFWYWSTKPKIESLRNIEWDNKLNKGVWRGTTTGREPHRHFETRRYIVEKSQDNPRLLDARFSHLSQGVILDESYLGEIMTPEKQQEYQFIVSKDGNGGTYGLYWQFASGSCLVLNSSFRQWFTPLFRRGVHFMWYNDSRNNEDLVDVLRSSSEKARTIAKTSKELSNKIFTDEFCIWYYGELIRQYAEKQK